MRPFILGGVAVILFQKKAIREEIWRLMECSGVSRFPKPVVGRIPNFVGSEKAAHRLISQREFQQARVVKVNPDSPQTHVRRDALLSGKLLLMPSPKLRKGFLLLDPDEIPKRYLIKSSTIKGALKHGKNCPLLELPKIDLIVAGTVAVSKEGIRVGKGGGYSDIEYGILRELGLAGEETPIFTTVHDIQIVEEAPKESHDFVVDAIITPSKTIRVKRAHSQPDGILWKKLEKHQLEAIPVLDRLKKRYLRLKEERIDREKW